MKKGGHFLVKVHALQSKESAKELMFRELCMSP